jgi:pimeloyl-ACP methyl ester carboxylesterase
VTPIPHWPGEFVGEVFVRAVPPAGGEPALCVHGLAGSARNWTDLMAELSPRLDCAAVDLPGYGESPPPPDGKYSISAQARTVAALIGRHGRGPVHLIGNSLGGAVCTRLAARRPDLIRSLTLISPALPDLQPRLDLVRFPLMSIPRVGAWALTKVKTISPERRVYNVLATCYYDASTVPKERFDAEVADLTCRDALPYADDVLIGSVRSLTAESLRAGPRSPWREAARITAPTLVIYGSNDRLVSPRMAGHAARTIRDSRVVVLPRTGHVAMMEHPALVAAEMAVLLGGIPVGPDRLLGRTGAQNGEHSVAAAAG